MIPRKLLFNDKSILKLQSGKYFVRELLGSGGYAEVYTLVSVTDSSKKLALKIYAGKVDNDNISIRRFVRERLVLHNLFVDKRFDSKHVVKIYNENTKVIPIIGSLHDSTVKIKYSGSESISGESYDVIEAIDTDDITNKKEYTPFFICELADYSLGQYLKDREQLNSEEAISIFKDVCLGLKSLHGYTENFRGEKETSNSHRDVKPENILLFSGKEKEFPFAKIADFGSVGINPKNFANKHTTLTKYLPPCTNTYSAPEIQENKLDHISDIYSIGITMMRSITGKLPTVYRSISDLLNEIEDIEVQRMIRMMTAEKREDRYQKIEEIIAEFNQYEDMINSQLNEEERAFRNIFLSLSDDIIINIAASFGVIWENDRDCLKNTNLHEEFFLRIKKKNQLSSLYDEIKRKEPNKLKKNIFSDK